MGPEIEVGLILDAHRPRLAEEFHRLLGHKSAGLDEPHGFSGDPASYECLLRLTFDNAGVPREDLARGDLSGVAVTDANS